MIIALSWIASSRPDRTGSWERRDDVLIGLSNFTRTITITAIPGNAEVRQVTVTINYTAGRFNRSYTLTTNISAFS